MDDKACRDKPFYNTGAKAPGFAADRDRPVSVTVDIPGPEPIPNRLFTTMFSTIVTVLIRADVDATTPQVLFFLCRKFHMAKNAFERDRQTVIFASWVGRITSTLYNGRMFISGNNRAGQTGTGSQARVVPVRWVRAPPVTDVWHYCAAMFVNTERGLYAFGYNNRGRLGVGHAKNVFRPSRVLIDGPVMEVAPFNDTTFIRTDAGWFGCGDGQYGQLGVAEQVEVYTPLPIRGSERVTRWHSQGMRTFAWTPNQMLGVGISGNGELAGLASSDWRVVDLTPLPVRYDDVATCGGTVVMRRGPQVWGCGGNSHRQIAATDEEVVRAPVRLDLPCPVTKVVVFRESVFVRRPDGVWVGRGKFDHSYFVFPDGDARRNISIEELGRTALPGWTGINERLKGELEGKNDVDTMEVPVG